MPSIFHLRKPSTASRRNQGELPYHPGSRIPDDPQLRSPHQLQPQLASQYPQHPQGQLQQQPQAGQYLPYRPPSTPESQPGLIVDSEAGSFVEIHNPINTSTTYYAANAGVPFQQGYNAGPPVSGPSRQPPPRGHYPGSSQTLIPQHTGFSQAMVHHSRGPSQALVVHEPQVPPSPPLVEPPAPPPVTAVNRLVRAQEVRELGDLIRTRYHRDLQIWEDRNFESWDSEEIILMMDQSDAALMEIKQTIAKWDTRSAFGTDEDFDKFLKIKERVEETGKVYWKAHPLRKRAEQYMA